MKLFRATLILLVFFAITAQAATSPAQAYTCGAPTSLKKNKNWCPCFHQYMVKECLRHDGDEEICMDEHLRKIMQPKITQFMQYYKDHKTKQMQKNPMLVMAYYFKGCPIVAAKTIKSKQFTIENFNITKKSGTKKHVIIIGLDGVRADVFKQIYQKLKQQHQDSYFTRLIDKAGINTNFYAGGVKGTKTQQKTLSEPGWVSILTGVWADKHNIKDNGDIKAKKYNHKIPTVYNIIRHKYPNALVASYSDWKPMSTFAAYQFYGNDAANINYFYDTKHISAQPSADYG